MFLSVNVDADTDDIERKCKREQDRENVIAMVMMVAVVALLQIMLMQKRNEAVHFFPISYASENSGSGSAVVGAEDINSAIP